MKKRILIIEDEPSMRIGMSHFLTSSGYDIALCEDGAHGFTAIENGNYDLIITDLKLPQHDGLEILKKAKSLYPETGVIIITAYSDVKTAVQAIKDGAFDYLAKPFSNEELLVVIERFFKFHTLKLEINHLKETLKEKTEFENIIGVSLSMRDIFDSLPSIAKSDVPVLIQGESGTGKELVANAIHDLSLRKDKLFIKINCAAIPETLLESELFGYEKGAFTGAIERKKGKFEIADGGSIFFDEIGDMPLALQTKILRLIEDQTVMRLGSSEPIKVNVRSIYATSRDLKEAIKDGEFRDALYYRINVIPITIPPLRERKEDIPYMIEHFLKQSGEKFAKPDLKISQPAYDSLLSYSYPGNVRELKHAIERAAVLSKDGTIETNHLPDEISSMREVILSISENLTLETGIRHFEKQRILKALNEAGGKRIETAKRLGISRKVLWKRLKDYGID